MNNDMIKPLIESKSLEGFVTFNIKNSETEILNQTIEEVIKYHKKIMKRTDSIKDPIKTKTNYVKEIPEFSIEITYLLKDGSEKTILYLSYKTEE